MDFATTNNTLAHFNKPNEESIERSEDNIYVKMTEDQFSQAVDSQISRANSYYAKLKIKERQDINLRYYLGDQVNKNDLRDDQERWVENVLFRNVETMIPIVTSNIPEPTITPRYKNDKTRKYAADVRRMLMAEWEVEQLMQSIIAKVVRNHQIDLLAGVQFGYDEDERKIYVDLVKVTDLIISQNGDFVARYIKDETLGDLLNKFPEKKDKILESVGFSASIELSRKILNTPLTYIEAWTDEVVGWKLNTLVLGLENNPHWDYDGKEMPYQNGSDPITGSQNTQTAKVFFNHFKKPKHPFLFFNYYNRGVYMYDDTTLLEQGIGLQDWINKRKRQIGLNADSTNGTWVGSGEFISEEEFSKITGGINEKIWGSKGNPANGIMKVTGPALPDYIYNDLVDSRSSLNTLMGIESATLGAQSQNDTLGQDVMQKQQNYKRLGGLIRDGVENFSKRFFDYMYHMYLVYKTDEDAIAIPEDDDFESDNVLFSRDSVPLILKKDGSLIPCPLIIKVKAGSTLPDDEVAEYQKAKMMANMLAPVDFFKKMGESNPRQLAKNFVINQMDPLFFFKDDPDIQKIMMQKQQEAMAAQSAEANKAAIDQQNKMNLEDKKTEGKKAVADMKNKQQNGKSGDSTPVGVSNALRALMQERGITAGSVGISVN